MARRRVKEVQSTVKSTTIPVADILLTEGYNEYSKFYSPLFKDKVKVTQCTRNYIIINDVVMLKADGTLDGVLVLFPTASKCADDWYSYKQNTDLPLTFAAGPINPTDKKLKLNKTADANFDEEYLVPIKLKGNKYVNRVMHVTSWDHLNMILIADEVPYVYDPESKTFSYSKKVNKEMANTPSDSSVKVELKVGGKYKVRVHGTLSAYLKFTVKEIYKEPGGDNALIMTAEGDTLLFRPSRVRTRTVLGTQITECTPSTVEIINEIP